MAPRKLLETQLLNKKHHSYEDIDNIPDRLRFCQHKLGLMQKEVAQIIGIPRITYINLETVIKTAFIKQQRTSFPNSIISPYTIFLMITTAFCLADRAKLIREYRESLNLGKRPFARLVSIADNMLRLWENERKQVSLKSLEKYFKNRIKV